MLRGEVAVGQRFLNTILHLFGNLFQLHVFQFSDNSFSLFPGSLLALLGVDRLEHLGYQLYLGARNNRKHIPVEMNGAALVFGIREYLSHSFQHTQHLSPTMSFTPFRPRLLSH